MVTRISRLQKFLKGTIQRAVSEVGLQDYEYETLHSLMIRDTPGTASPTDLADDLGVSGAGMTGRLDGLEKSGWVQRTQSPDDRRRVVVEITEGTDGDRFWRGDAVEVLVASADRVEAPCPVAGPGLYGGCDFQHVALPAQRELKATVVREQLVRLGRLPADDPLVAGLVVEPVPGDEHGLRWRTRMQWAHTDDGRRGLRAHRSRRVVPVEDCLIARHDARTPEPGPPITETVEGREFVVEPDGFWQVHPGAPSVLVSTVLDLLDPRPGERVLDLYAGVGLFARFLGEVTGARLVAVEADRAACGHARANLAGHEGAVV